MPDGDVQFQSPTTGVVRGVPAEHWDEALKQGYKPVSHTVMYDKDGNRGMVPNQEVPQRSRDGYRTTPQTQFEKERDPATHEGFFSHAASVLGNQIEGAALASVKPWAEAGKTYESYKRARAGGAGIGDSIVKAAKSAMVRDFLENPGVDTVLNYDRRRQAGYGPVYSATAPTAAQAVNVNLPSMEHEADIGNTRGVAAEAVVPAIETGIAEASRIPAVKSAAKWAGEVTRVTPAAEKFGALVQGAVTGKPSGPFIPEAQKAMTQAIQPGVNIPKAQESIKIAGPRLQQLRKAGALTDLEGNPLTEIRTTGDQLGAIRSAKKVVLGEIEKRLGPVADLQIDTSSIAKEMRSSVSKRLREQFPAQADAIEKRAASYDQPHTLRELEEAIIDANDDLKGYYRQPVAGESSVSGSTKATLAEVRRARALLDEKVGDLSGDGVKDLKREYGALRDMERATARQHAVQTRTKEGGLWEGLSYLHAADAALSGNLLGVARAIGGMSVGKMLKTLRNPDFLIEQSFHGPKAFEAAEPFRRAPGPPEPKGLLPAPAREATPAGWSEPDTSGPVRGGRWTTPAAQLPERNITPTEFVREIPKTPARGVQEFAKNAPAGFEPLLKETGWEYGGKNSMGIHEFKEPGSNISISVLDKNMNPDAVRERMSAKLREFGRPGLNEPGKVQPEYAREETRPPETSGERDPAAQLGTMGRGGVRTTPKGQLPGQSLEGAKYLVQQTLDMMRSGDRPGRYFDQIESTAQGRAGGWKTGLRMGGQWRGVKSMRTMLPWINETDFTPGELENALKQFEKGRINSVMRSAIDFVERQEKKSSLLRAAQDAMREPGADEEEENKSEGGEAPF